MDFSLGGIASTLTSTFGIGGSSSGGNGPAAIPRSNSIPTNIAPIQSQTSDALTCFTNQQFSGKLQAYMVNYVISVNSIYSVYIR